jgi:hypothetical protein
MHLHKRTKNPTTGVERSQAWQVRLQDNIRRKEIRCTEYNRSSFFSTLKNDKV